MVIMFLFADLAVPQAVPEWNEFELEDEISIQKTTSAMTLLNDTAIDSSSPNTNYGSSETVDLGQTIGGESRILISFNNTVPSGDMVTSATLNLTCGINPLDIDSINIYTATLKKTWVESSASWTGPDNGVFWGMDGADDTSDRGEWEPPFYGYDNNTFQINITAIAQDAVINNKTAFNILVAATGSPYSCHMSESLSTNSRPSLSITHQSGSHTNGGTLNPNFVEDGAALMDTTQFVLTAETNPEITWDSFTGTDAQVQLSLSPQFKDENDDTWYYNSDDNSSMFTINTNSGSITIPTQDSLSNGTTIHYRIRSVDSTDTIGDWEIGYFHLPYHDVTISDGYGQISIDFDDLSLSENTIEDTFVDSSSAARNTNMGSSENITVGSSSNSNQYGLMRINMDDIGLHSNSSIISANLVMSRSAYTGSADVSLHIMSGENWEESSVTWRKYDGINDWNDGGRLPSMSIGDFTGDQSSATIDVNITAALQYWNDQSNSATQTTTLSSKALDLMMVASTWGQEVSTSQFVNLCSSEANSCNKPKLEITYDWGSNGPPTIPTHLSPLDGHPVWNLSGHNLSANTMPTLSWDGTINWAGDMLMEVSTDQEYRDIIHSFNTATSSEFNETDGNWSISSSDSLDEGVMYHWRLAQIDSSSHHHSWWSTSSFLVSSLESEYLQDDDHRLRLSHGNATTAGDAPSCMDTYIDSGTPNSNYNDEEDMQVSYNTFPSETSILIGCDLKSHLIPDGYAVKTATLKMRLADYPSGTPTVGVWESRQNNWTEEKATWSSYDGVNSWGTSGAKGWERAGLQDSESLGNSYSAGDWVEFDVTLAVQNAMREDRAVDLIVGIVGVGSGVDRNALFYPNNVNSANRPEISFVYLPGSDAIPSEPVLTSPLNGSWSVESGINPAPLDTPQLGWSYSTSTTSVGGWSIEMDTTSSFNSANLIMATSWTDSGFDVTNMTFDVTSSLDVGETWYWRVRATSITNQIGNWSNTFHFLLPDLTTWSISNNSAAIELHHREAMPDLNIPNFIDTWVADAGQASTNDQSSSSTFRVGTSSTGQNATGLMKIPLTELPNPQNSHISKAVLNLYAQFGSDTDNAISIHPSLVSWNTNATGTTYDGVNNWSLPGAIGSADRGQISDIKVGASADWMEFDITEIIQQSFANGNSHALLTIVGSVGEGQTIFTSTSGNQNERPWVNLTWTTGNASSPEVSGNNTSPSVDEIIWDTSSHALLPGATPMLTWSHPNNSNVDDWRVVIWNDYSNEREGWTVYDSRESTEGWDLTNQSWTSPDNLSTGDSYKWFVQPITDDILGARSNETVFHIPKLTGEKINSTDASIALQEGQVVEGLDYPSIFMDTYLDSGTTNSGYESADRLIMGRSNLTSSLNYETVSLLQVDWSSMPIPANHEYIHATMTLSKLSGGETNQETVRIAVCEVTQNWNESVTYNSPNGTSAAWLDEPCDVPFEIVYLEYQENTVEFDITYAVQHAHADGTDKINLAFLIIDDTTDEWHFASSDYISDESKRPELELTWRNGTQWLPSAATNLAPADGSTIWNETASRPRGADSNTLNWSSTETNQSRWIMQISKSDDFTDENETFLFDLSNSSTFDGIWDLTNLSYTIDNLSSGDYWVYWRVRADQDHRLGKWSDVHSYRVPGIVGSDDGSGNQSVTLYDGSVFDETGSLPEIPDATIDSNRANTKLGNNGRLDLGISAGGSGESKIVLTFDLNELPFPTTMTPTSALLSLYRYNVSGTSSLTVSAHACDTFDEDNVTWNSSPTCSNTEITRSTMFVVPTVGVQIWDITSLAQSNAANGNNTLTVMLKSVGNPSSGHSFYDNSALESLRPRLILDYVDNVDGIIPPAQPVLTYPNDGAILYNTSTWELESLDKPQLTWNSVVNATGYVVTIATSDGQLKYKSWVDSEINGTTFTFSQDLVAGEVYSWWVQAINESIPGPSSSRRAFAIGSPVNNTYNDDHTWTYIFQTGNEVADLGHTNIRDSYIGSNSPNTNHGADSLSLGFNCEGPNSECRSIIALDNSQIPLPMSAKIHSASLNLQIDVPTPVPMTFYVHRLITNSWSESGSTWNNSQSGTPWSAGGMTAGVEYDANPISSVTIQPGDTDVWIDIGHNGMTINGDHTWILIAAPASGANAAHVEFYSSEDSLELRPMIKINYTDVNAVSIAPVSSTTDADTPVQFSHILTNAVGGNVAENVTWSSTNGAIDVNGLFTPQLVGVHNITACFGVICDTQSISVTPGLPTTLVVDDVEETISADQSFTIQASVVDQHGNTVPGLTIAYTPSNGSMVGATFYPYSAGLQSISVEWMGQIITVNVEVVGGAPVSYRTTGCEQIIHAGKTCQLNWTLHDQFGNELDLAVGGGITWTAGGGVFTESNGTYFATTVGNYNITMQSTGGITHTIPVQVTHGEIANLEITASSTSVTADDIVWLNTTRVDIMGNRLPVLIPKANWTISDGMITEGQPAEWHAQKRGTKTLTASYAGTENSVTIQVTEGAITGLVLVIDSVDSTGSLQEITADDEIEIKVKAIDSDGNRWTENVAWTVEHVLYNDQSVLQEMTYGSTTMFVPVFASDSLYTLRASYSDENLSSPIQVTLSISVDHGELVSVSLIQPSNLVQNIDADDDLTFIPLLNDSDGNIIDSSIISYTLDDLDRGLSSNITTLINDNLGVWEATKVGNYSITAWAISESGYNISETVDITVNHGVSVSIDIDVLANTAKAGDVYNIEITGTDEDGNTFPESVIWTENNKPVPPSTMQPVVGSEGQYTWSATTKGVHTFNYRAPSGVQNQWTVTVSAHQTVDRIELTILQESVLQLESFDIEVKTYDAWENQIPVPPNTQIELSGRMTAKAGENGNWTITTLDDEEQTVTIRVDGKEASGKINVEGTFMGFFEAGGVLYYAGGILAILVVLVLLVVIIMILRSGESDYDDDDYDDDDDDDQPQAAGPSGPGPVGPGPSEPPPQTYTPSQPDWAVEYRIDDEDGTAWAEAEDGTWYYWDQDRADWEAWE